MAVLYPLAFAIAAARSELILAEARLQKKAQGAEVVNHQRPFIGLSVHGQHTKRNKESREATW